MKRFVAVLLVLACAAAPALACNRGVVFSSVGVVAVPNVSFAAVAVPTFVPTVSVAAPVVFSAPPAVVAAPFVVSTPAVVGFPFTSTFFSSRSSFGVFGSSAVVVRSGAVVVGVRPRIVRERTIIRQGLFGATRIDRVRIGR